MSQYTREDSKCRARSKNVVTLLQRSHYDLPYGKTKRAQLCNNGFYIFITSKRLHRYGHKRIMILKCSLSSLVSLAVAIYTGMETKMALNYQSKSQKRSAVEK